jgi:hypothetical protein
MSPQEGEDQMFGPPPPESVYWSQPNPNPAQPTSGREVKMGDHTLKLEQTAESTVMKLPGIVPALLAHGKKLAEAATANAQVTGARYEAVLVHDSNGDPKVVVQTANQQAEFDEAAHSTLTAAMTTAIAQASAQEER